MRTNIALKSSEPMAVEAASLTIQSRPWLTGLCATPWIDENGQVTDYWIATEVTTGTCVDTKPCRTLAGLAVAVGQWASKNNITERRWKEIISRTRRRLLSV